MRFAAIYASGQVMGFTPTQIDALSVFQFVAICEGFAKAHSQDDKKLTEAEMSDLWDLVQAS